jgi:hypothetical protein
MNGTSLLGFAPREASTRARDPLVGEGELLELPIRVGGCPGVSPPFARSCRPVISSAERQDLPRRQTNSVEHSSIHG